MSCANLKGLDWGDPDFDVINIGLTSEQIDEMGLMRINNLETGGGKNLADPAHSDHYKPYVQNYIRDHGVWKCEANALVSNPEGAVGLFEGALSQFIPPNHWVKMYDKNSDGRASVRIAIESIMKSWSFEDE